MAERFEGKVAITFNSQVRVVIDDLDVSDWHGEMFGADHVGTWQPGAVIVRLLESRRRNHVADAELIANTDGSVMLQGTSMFTPGL